MFFRHSKQAEIKADIIFVMGGPGSGKGTQCEILAKNKGYCHISPGEMIRKILEENKDSNDSRIQNIRDSVKQGALLDDKIIIDLIKSEIDRHPEAKGFLIDGCPRTLDQVILFEKEIKPCDKILFFDVSEKIMRERMQHRSEVEDRKDDNEIAIENRIKTYQTKTMAVIDFLRNERSANFIPIDAKDDIEPVAKKVRHALADDTVTKVSAFQFLKSYLSCGNFYQTVDELEKQHGSVNFEVNLPFATLFYIIQNRKDVEKILSSNTTLGYQYNNFNVTHGHALNIMAIEAFKSNKNKEKNPIWANIHSGLAQSVGDRELIKKLISKHIPKLFSKTVFNLDVAFEDFMLDFWCEYLFGANANSQDYRKLREKLLAATHYAYYENGLRTVPYLGNLTCRFYGYLKGNEFKEIDQMLLKFINESNSGMMHRFKSILRNSTTFPREKVNQAVLDNAFDFILVFDFIHNAMYESLVSVVKNELDKTDDRRKIYKDGLSTAFLFQYRSRVPQENIKLQHATISKGIPTYVNLLQAGFTHSHGPRSCIGAGVSNWIQETIWEHLQDKELRVVKKTISEERAKLSHNLDVPISPERYEVRWEYPRNYLQRILPDYKFKGVDHFYDVLKTYEKPELVDYIVAAFVEKIQKLNIDPSELCIAAPEVRGVPIAAMVAKELKIPFVMIRKPEKIPGPVFFQKYSTAYSSDILEISKESQVKKNVILIDDGIASGGTTLACCNLLEKFGSRVQSILAMINHTYSEKPEALKQYAVHTLFDFDANSAQLVQSQDKTQVLEYKRSERMLKTA